MKSNNQLLQNFTSVKRQRTVSRIQNAKKVTAGAVAQPDALVAGLAARPPRCDLLDLLDLHSEKKMPPLRTLW